MANAESAAGPVNQAAFGAPAIGDATDIRKEVQAACRQMVAEVSSSAMADACAAVLRQKMGAEFPNMGGGDQLREELRAMQAQLAEARTANSQLRSELQAEAASGVAVRMDEAAEARRSSTLRSEWLTEAKAANQARAQAAQSARELEEVLSASQTLELELGASRASSATAVAGLNARAAAAEAEVRLLRTEFSQARGQASFVDAGLRQNGFGELENGDQALGLPRFSPFGGMTPFAGLNDAYAREAKDLFAIGPPAEVLLASEETPRRPAVDVSGVLGRVLAQRGSPPRWDLHLQAQAYQSQTALDLWAQQLVNPSMSAPSAPSALAASAAAAAAEQRQFAACAAASVPSASSAAPPASKPPESPPLPVVMPRPVEDDSIVAAGVAASSYMTSPVEDDSVVAAGVAASSYMTPEMQQLASMGLGGESNGAQPAFSYTTAQFQQLAASSYAETNGSEGAQPPQFVEIQINAAQQELEDMKDEAHRRYREDEEQQEALARLLGELSHFKNSLSTWEDTGPFRDLEAQAEELRRLQEREELARFEAKHLQDEALRLRARASERLEQAKSLPSSASVPSIRPPPAPTATSASMQPAKGDASAGIPVLAAAAADIDVAGSPPAARPTMPTVGTSKASSLAPQRSAPQLVALPASPKGPGRTSATPPSGARVLSPNPRAEINVRRTLGYVAKTGNSTPPMMLPLRQVGQPATPPRPLVGPPPMAAAMVSAALVPFGQNPQRPVRVESSPARAAGAGTPPAGNRVGGAGTPPGRSGDVAWLPPGSRLAGAGTPPMQAQVNVLPSSANVASWGPGALRSLANSLAVDGRGAPAQTQPGATASSLLISAMLPANDELSGGLTLPASWNWRPPAALPAPPQMGSSQAVANASPGTAERPVLRTMGFVSPPATVNAATVPMRAESPMRRDSFGSGSMSSLRAASPSISSATLATASAMAVSRSTASLPARQYSAPFGLGLAATGQSPLLGAHHGGNGGVFRSESADVDALGRGGIFEGEAAGGR